MATSDWVGDAWRTRWDSLRLFTPARFSALPGMPAPAAPNAFPTKDEMADYLEAYTQRFGLPVHLGSRVEALDRDGGQFALTVGDRQVHADHVVVATGGGPRVPPFAADVDPAVTQLHASGYHHPDQLPPGAVLVVGAGNSGAEIALELARAHQVLLSGRDTGRIPLITGRWCWWLIHRLLTVDTRAGRAFSRVKQRGTPLVRIRARDLARAGIRRLPPLQGVRAGQPVLTDGSTVEAATVLWCTGYRFDHSRIHLPDVHDGVDDHDAQPAHYRGVATNVPGCTSLACRSSTRSPPR